MNLKLNWLTVLIVLAVAFGISEYNGWIDFVPDGTINNGPQGFDSSGSACTPTYRLSLSSVASEFTQNKLSENNYELILTSADLNSANNTALAFTIDTTRTDECRAADGSLLQTVLNYDVSANTFKNVVDLSDATMYYTVQYADTDNQYNVTADGVAFATVNEASDVVTHSSAGAGVITTTFEDFTSYDKGVSDNYNFMTVETVSTKAGSVIIKYMKD